MRFSSPSPSPTADSGSIFGGVSPLAAGLFRARTGSGERQNQGGASGERKTDSHAAVDVMATPRIVSWWTAFSGQANVIGVPCCRSGGSHVLAVRTVAVSVTPGGAVAAMRVVGPA